MACLGLAFLFPLLAAFAYFLVWLRPEQPGWPALALFESDSGGNRGLAPGLLRVLLLMAGSLGLLAGLRLPRRWYQTCYLGFLLLSLVSALTCAHPHDALLAWLLWLGIGAAFAVAAALSGSVEPELKRLLLLATVLAVLPAAFSSYSDGTGAFAQRIQGSFFLPGLLAAYLLLFFPLAWTGAAGGSRQRWGCAAMAGLIGAALLLTFTRAAIVLMVFQAVVSLALSGDRGGTRTAVLSALGLGTICAAALWLGRLTGALGMMTAVGAGAAAVLLAVVLGCFTQPRRVIVSLGLAVLVGTCWLLVVEPEPQNLAAFATTRASRLSQGDTSTSSRLAFWRAGWKLTLENPWLGVGPGGFARYYPRHQPALEAYSSSPHNLVVSLASETGLPALFLLLAALVGLGLDGLAGIRACPSGVEHEVRTGTLAGLTGFFLLGLVDVNWEYPALLVTAATMAGILVPAPPTSEAAPQRRWIPGLALGLLALLQLPVLTSEGLALQGLEMERAGQYRRALELYRRAARRDPWSPAVHRGAARALLSLPNRTPEELELLLERARAAYRLDPAMAAHAQLVGSAHLARGEHEKATEFFELAIRLDQYNYPGFYYDLARTYAARQQPGRAWEILAGVVRRYTPDRLDAAYDYRETELKEQLALVYVLMGELLGPQRQPARAEHYFRKSVALNPTVRGHFGLGVCLYQQGRPREALEQFLKADALYPGFSQVEQLIEACREALSSSD